MKDFDSEKTKEFFAKLYYKRSETLSPDQISGMLDAVISFCQLFPNTEVEIKELERIYFEPIKCVVEKYGAYMNEKKIKRLNFTHPLSQIEWLYYRDGQARTPLNKHYYGDIYDPRINKVMYWQDIVDLRHNLKKLINSIFVSVVKREGFTLGFDIGAFNNKIIQVDAYGESGLSNIN
jgi:hypothetical protein